MPIQNVNGRNVYVITPKPADSNKFDWGAQYTQMRWMIWEETQRNQARMLEVELQETADQRAYWADKIDAIQKDRTETIKAAQKAAGGDKSEAMRIRQRSAEELRRLSAKAPIVTQTDQFATDKHGDFIYADDQYETYKDASGRTQERLKEDAVPMRKQKTTTKTGGQYQVDQGLIDYHKRIVGATDEELVGMGLARDFDQELEALDAQLADAIAGRDKVAMPDYDLAARTRRAFSEGQGVIGQGGTMFGMAPRKQRTHHYVDQGLMKPRVAEFEQAALAEQAERTEAAEGVAALDERIFELEALGGTPDGVDQTSTMLQMAMEQRGKLQDRLNQPTMVETAMGSEDFKARAAGDLFRRGAPAQVTGDAAGMVVTGGADIEGADGMTIEGAGDQTGALEAPVRDIPAITPKGEGDIGNYADLEAMGVTPEPVVEEPLPQYSMPAEKPALDLEPLAINEDEAMRNPDILRQEGYVADENLQRAAREWAKHRDLDTGQPRNPERAAKRAAKGLPVKAGTNRRVPVRKQFESKEDMIEAYLEDLKVQKETAPVSTSTRKQRYKTLVVRDGVELAKTPKKFERIAKTNVESDQRPAHINIVDKLYRVNKGKEGAFKNTYEEINRAFAADPDTRKQAHTYLVALDIMTENISEPMA